MTDGGRQPYGRNNIERGNNRANYGGVMRAPASGISPIMVNLHRLFGVAARLNLPPGTGDI